MKNEMRVGEMKGKTAVKLMLVSCIGRNVIGV